MTMKAGLVIRSWGGLSSRKTEDLDIEIALRVGEADGEFARRQLWHIQRHRDDTLAHIVAFGLAIQASSFLCGAAHAR